MSARRRTQTAAGGQESPPLHMDTLECSSERVEELDESLTVLNYDGRKWLIGVQVAAALNRETFNMYRSMKVKGVDLTRAAPAHVDWLIRQGVVKGGTHSVTLIPYDTGLSFIHSVVIAGMTTTPPSTRKVKRGASAKESVKESVMDGLVVPDGTGGSGNGKRTRDPIVAAHPPAPPPDRQATVAAKKLRSSTGGAVLSLFEEEDSDDFSDDVVQPTKRRRITARPTAKRPSPRRTRATEPSYSLSTLPRFETSFASARFLPTQATIPTLVPVEEEERPERRTRRWPLPNSTTARKANKPPRPMHVSRRKLASYQVVRAIQPEDCVPFKFKKSMLPAADMAEDEEPSVAASWLHSLLRAAV